jgi:hypothetical protein
MVKQFYSITAQLKTYIRPKNIYGLIFLCLSVSASAREDDTASAFVPHGKLWGSTFGDFGYKSNADLLNRGIYQYSGMPQNTNLFQFRRIYLGYYYDINPRFSADMVLAAEADYQGGLLGQAPASVTVNTLTGTSTSVTLGNNGDLLLNNKFSPYVKLANLRWKELWKGTDLVVGLVNTPAYGINGRNDQTSEEVWGYRSLEKTVSDLRGTPCFDFGAELQGWFDKRGNFGYDLMVGNGQQAKPENDPYKWFYGDVYAKFMDKRIVVDLYQDYEKLNWGVYTKGPNGAWYHDRNMTKLFAAWNTRKLTVGFEGFRNTIMGDIKVTGKDGNTYYRTTNAMATSFFVRGAILSDSKNRTRLGFFARYDNYDPSGDLSGIINDPNTKTFTNLTSYYDPTTKEQFAIAGLDYMPVKNVHIMPNLWLYTYTSVLSPDAATAPMNIPNITGIKGTDVVWRISFYYIYGK